MSDRVSSRFTTIFHNQLFHSLSDEFSELVKNAILGGDKARAFAANQSKRLASLLVPQLPKTPAIMQAKDLR